MQIFAPEAADLSSHLTQARDGVSLVLHRRVISSSPPKATVLLCHNMGCNSNIWDLRRAGSLAVYLARDGYDVWRMDFRGCGLSGPASPETSIEDYALKDIPAAVEYVTKTTGRPGLVLVGHGLGGSAALVYLLSCRPANVEGLVLIGAPLTASLPKDAIFADLSLAEKCLGNPLSRYPSATRGLIPVPPKGWDCLFGNPDNMSAEVREALICDCSEPIPKGLGRQFLQMVETGTLRSPDGKRAYFDEVSGVRLPILAICGKADNLAPPAALRSIFHKAASMDKTFRLFCRANGDGADFGSADLICGNGAEATVFPEIAKWLKARTNGGGK